MSVLNVSVSESWMSNINLINKACTGLISQHFTFSGVSQNDRYTNVDDDNYSNAFLAQTSV